MSFLQLLLIHFLMINTFSKPIIFSTFAFIRGNLSPGQMRSYSQYYAEDRKEDPTSLLSAQAIQKPVYNAIFNKLTDSLNPTKLLIIDQSSLHSSHQEMRLHSHKYPSGESHFRIEVESDKFKGLTSLQRHRLVHKILEKEIKTKIHALSIIASTP